MKKQFWSMLELFDPPMKGTDISFREVRLDTPEGVDELIRKDWDKQLLAKQGELAKLGRATNIKPYHLDSSDKPLSALYEGEKAVMWPGQVITLVGVNRKGNKVILDVGQTSFPFINGLKNPEIAKLYERRGIPKQRPALAISTLAITSDNYIAMTLRGPATNMYPGRIYGQGGNPASPKTKVIEHQIEEIEDEILATKKDYNPQDFRFGGICIDEELLPGKPDLVGWVQIKLDSKNLEQRVKARDIKRRPNDAVDIVFIPNNEQDLFKALTDKEAYKKFNPPGYASLFIYGRAIFGKPWAERVIKTIEKKG
jgi:hypothetical protein